MGEGQPPRGAHPSPFVFLPRSSPAARLAGGAQQHRNAIANRSTHRPRHACGDGLHSPGLPRGIGRRENERAKLTATPVRFPLTIKVSIRILVRHTAPQPSAAVTV